LESNPVSHGHAVGVGMLAESYLSYKREILSENNWIEIESILSTVFPKIEFEKEDIPTLIHLMKNDKKNFEGQIKCCVLKDIGDCIFDQNVGEKELTEVFNYLLSI
jgi:3-dehydroquinate synthase